MGQGIGANSALKKADDVILSFDLPHVLDR
jgi:hypothetical protein